MIGGFGTVVDDKRIQLGAYDEINRDKELVLKNRVMIAVYNGVMLLMGEVRTPDLKQRAEQTVTGFEGVRRIVNEIDVMEPEGFWTRRNDNKITARVKLRRLPTSPACLASTRPRSRSAPRIGPCT